MKNIPFISLVMVTCGLLLQSCDQHHSNGQMMNGGMMGGDIMGQTSPGNGTQSLPEPQSGDAQLFQQYCSQCHTLPIPAAHTAQE